MGASEKSAATFHDGPDTPGQDRLRREFIQRGPEGFVNVPSREAAPIPDLGERAREETRRRWPVCTDRDAYRLTTYPVARGAFIAGVAWAAEQIAARTPAGPDARSLAAGDRDEETDR